MESDVGLIFLTWMLMTTMIDTLSYKSRARTVISTYLDESMGQWSLPILLGLGRCQYSRFDPLRMWYKDPRQITHWRFIENLAWHTTNTRRIIACPTMHWRTS
jgi:hypothetical protein